MSSANDAARGRSLSDRAVYERLCRAIYAASLDAEQWPSALEEIREATGSVAVLLGIGHGASTRQPGFDLPDNMVGAERELFPFLMTHGLDMDLWRIFVERYLHHPWSEHFDTLPLWQATEASRFVSRDQIRRTGFYQEILKPQTIADNTNLILSRGPGELRQLVLMRPFRSSLVDPNNAMMDKLAPHLTTALDIMHALSASADKAAQFALGLDTSSRVAFLVDPEGLVIDASPNMHRLVGPDRPFQISKDGVLKLSRSQDAAKLRAAIISASNDRSKRASARTGAPAIINAVDPISLRNLLIVVSPARGEARTSSFPSRVSAVVIARDTDWSAEQKASLLKAAYGVTDREAQITLSLIETGLLSDVARRLQIKLSTAQTHIRSVMRKVGVKSQVALVARVCSELPL